jgi:hypothetical protein
MKLLMIAAALAAAQAGAETRVSPNHDPARLDRLLAESDFDALGRTVMNPEAVADVSSDLMWLKARMMEGSSAYVSLLYARCSGRRRKPSERPSGTSYGKQRSWRLCTRSRPPRSMAAVAPILAPRPTGSARSFTATASCGFPPDPE